MTLHNEQVDLSSLRINRDQPPERRPGRVKWMILGVAAAAVVVLAVIYFPALKPAATVTVTTVALTYPSQANAVLTASGYIVPQRKASVASKGTGRLVYLGVEEGDHVRAGQVIARLESNDVEARLNQSIAAAEAAKAQVAQQEASLEQAKKEYERNDALFKKGVITDSEFEIKKLGFQSAQAQLNAARATLVSYQAAVEASRVDMENTVIRAPFDGTVLTKQADVGEIVAPFAAGNSRGAVVSMADMTSLQLEADVSESNIERVKLDQPCEIVLDAFPERRYRGVVWKIVPTADRAKATILTKVKFLDIDKKVLPDMAAKVTFLTQALSDSAAQAPPKITIPLTALTDRHGRKVAFVVEDGRLKEIAVTTGSMVNDRIEVLAGLIPGQKVVKRATEDLRDGARVTVGD